MTMHSLAPGRLFLVGLVIASLAGCSDFSFPRFGSGGSGKSAAEKKAMMLPPAPAPIYEPGDTFVYDENGNVSQEQVVAVTPDRVTWTNDKGLIWTAAPDMVTPALSWSSDPELGRGRQTIIGNPMALFPLQEGNVAAFGVRGNSETVPAGWSDENRCVVSGQEDVKVPAGNFTTFRIDCQRRDFTESLYYAPVAQNYVLRVRNFATGPRKKELISVALANDRTRDLPVSVAQDMHARKAGDAGATPGHAGGMPAPAAAPMGAVRAEPMSAGQRLEKMVDPLEKVVMQLAPISGEGGLAAQAPAAGAMEKPADGGKPMAKAEMAAKGGKYGLHLASYRTAQAAQRGWRALAAKFKPELGDLSMRTAEFDSGDGRGTFIRLIGSGYETEKAAEERCTKLKAKRQFCQAIRVLP